MKIMFDGLVLNLFSDKKPVLNISKSIGCCEFKGSRKPMAKKSLDGKPLISGIHKWGHFNGDMRYEF